MTQAAARATAAIALVKNGRPSTPLRMAAAVSGPKPGSVKLSLAGLSDNAPALIAVLEQLPHLQAVKFDEPVAADDGRRKDRFRLSAAIAGAKGAKP